MENKFFFDSAKKQPETQSEAGSFILITDKDVPGFNNIAYGKLKLNQGGAIEPIWHPNANKIGYCTQGKLLVSIRTPETNEVFTVSKGEMCFIPKGYVHHFENLDAKESVISFAFDNNFPELMQFSKAIYSLKDTVFNTTFHSNSSFAEGLAKTKSNTVLRKLPKTSSIGKDSSKYKFNIEGAGKPVQTPGGYLRFGIQSVFPALQGLGILGFGLNAKGCVEPHWHTNAGELVFIVKGATRITILSPDGSITTHEVGAGQGIFAPASHFHNIENISSEEAEVIAFFNNAAPDYIGVAEVFGSYSNDFLASVFNVEPGYFEQFKKTEKPLIIVPV